MKINFDNRKKLALILTISAVVLIVVGVILFKIYNNTTVQTVESTPTPEATVLPSTVSNLTGLTVAADVANRRTVAAMIENSPAARPQAGLINADIVYEAVTEGGITRFMGIFQSNYPEKAGPIRSARSYFIDYLSEYDSMYVHAGGSSTALPRIKEYGIKDYPHSTDAYWRIPQAGVASEHTLYANIKKVFDAGINNKKWSVDQKVDSWKFEAPGTAGTVASAKINFSSATYAVEWKYDTASKLYYRLMANSPHKDRTTNEQITRTNVVAIQVTHSANPKYASGKESEWTMQTFGTGKAWVFRNGEKIEGTWKKDSRTARTRFLDSAGAEISLNPGKIWVEVIPQEGSVTSL